MTTTTLSEANVDDSPPLPSSPVVKDPGFFDVLTQDRSDPNDTDDECDQTWVNDSNDDDDNDDNEKGDAGLGAREGDDADDKAKDRDDDDDDDDDSDDSDEEADEAEVASALVAPVEDPLLEKACIAANKTFSATQDSGTPLKRTTHRITEFKNSDHIKEFLLDELGPMNTIPRVDIVKWISPAYEHLAEESRINEFLRESDEYHNHRWRVIPKNPKREIKLYDPVCDLWNAILDHFGPPGIADVRRAVATDRVDIKHHAIHTSSPDICIEASGPSFTLAPREMIGFSNIAAFVDGKLEKDISNLQAHMVQLGGYARCLIIFCFNKITF
jgi:hypothetical protein